MIFFFSCVLKSRLNDIDVWQTDRKESRSGEVDDRADDHNQTEPNKLDLAPDDLKETSYAKKYVDCHHDCIDDTLFYADSTSAIRQ